MIPNRTETHTSTGPCGGAVAYEQPAGKGPPGDVDVEREMSQNLAFDQTLLMRYFQQIHFKTQLIQVLATSCLQVGIGRQW